MKTLPDLDPTKGYLTSLTLENIRCFGSPAEKLSLTVPGSETQPARWTVILGANGVGKTTVLRALAIHQRTQSNPLNLDRSQSLDGRIVIDASNDNGSKYKAIMGGMLGSKWSALFSVEIALLCGYGAGRAWRGLGEKFFNATDTLFDRTAQVRNPSQTLADWTTYELSKPSDSPSIVASLKEALRTILPDVSDVKLDFDREKRPFASFQTPDGWIALDDMSWGYQVFAAFAADYASRLIEWYPQSKEPLAEPGICLVDELDLHMHPSWQRKVIDDLSRIFPATQFIVTVHSPLVVQAAEDANLVVLKRYPDDPSRVQIDNNVEAIKGWRIDQVLTSDLFGLDSARSPNVADNLAERRKLLGNDDLTTEETARLKVLEEQAMSLPTPGGSFEQEALKLVAEAAAKLKQLG
jgi:energy-coupling factor transporter ATP-binding protein EcfA2